MRSQRRRAGALIALGAKAEKRGDYARARQYYERALALRRAEYGAAHPRVADSLDRLGTVLTALGDHAAARDCHEQALAIARAAFGDEHPAVARSLNGLGRTALYRGEHAAARGFFEQALAIRRRAFGEEHPDVAASLNNLGVISRDLGDYAAARDYFEQALAIRRRAFGEEHPDVAASLNNLGIISGYLGDYGAARECYERALAIRRLVLGEGHPDTAKSLNNLGIVLSSMGEHATARGYYEQALAIRRRAFGEEHPDVAASLNNLGAVSYDLGDYAAARKYFEQALSIRRRTFGEDHPDVARSLNNLGVVSCELGDYVAAQVYHEQALSIRRRILGDHHPDVARSLNNLGVVSCNLGNYAAARGYHEQALSIRRRALGEQHRDVAGSLNGLAEICRKEGDLEHAGRLLEEALRIALLPDNVVRLPETYQELSALNAALGAPEAAIFFGKRAVNAIQRQRGRLTALDRELQRSFVASKESIYRHLADLLVEAGRLGEAQQVLTMLKEEELFDLLRRNAASDPRLTFAQLTSREAEWQRHGDELGHSLVRLTGEIKALRQMSARSPDEEVRLRAARAALDEAGRRFHTWLIAVRTEMAESREHAEQVAALNLQAAGALQADLRALGPDVALVHYLVGESRLSIILTTAGFQVSRDAAVAAKTVNRLVHEWRLAIDQRLAEAEPLAQTLHRHLIAPIAPLLEEAGIRLLMLVPYGTLRYLPFAALHDGAHYLAERYATAMLTPAAHSRIKDQPLAAWRVAGLGVAREVPGYRRLPAVAEELRSIVRVDGANEGVYPGTLRLDEAFTEEALAEALESHPAVHVASHFVFEPAQEWGSYLLLGDGGQLTVERLRDWRFDFAGVELMTLSACETAMGGGQANGREFEGFGALVQQRGAKAVIASLWPVADASTPLLMRHFYQARHAGLSKAAALQRAQRVLLDEADAAGHDYAHPYHWAPFVLMGDWL